MVFDAPSRGVRNGAGRLPGGRGTLEGPGTATRNLPAKSRGSRGVKKARAAGGRGFRSLLPFEGQLFAARLPDFIESQGEFQYQNWFFQFLVLLVDSSETPDGDSGWVGRVGLTGSRHGLLSRGRPRKAGLAPCGMDGGRSVKTSEKHREKQWNSRGSTQQWRKRLPPLSCCFARVSLLVGGPILGEVGPEIFIDSVLDSIRF